MGGEMSDFIEDLIIDRSNFKQNRKSYGISLKDIAERSKLSTGVISNYENYTGQYTQTRTRDDNARIIVRALKDLIQEHIDNIFMNGTNKINNKEEKEIKKMEEKKMITSDSIVLDGFAENDKTVSLDELVEKREEKDNTKIPKNYKRGYNKGKIVTKLHSYCKENKISFSDFCSMCGINCSTLAPYSIERTPILSERLLLKICEATGWDADRFEEDRYYNLEEIGCKIPSVKIKTRKNKKEKTINKKDTITMKQNTINSDKIEGDNIHQIQDKKYVFQDGSYYEEYVEVIYIKKRNKITREQFLAAV